MADIRIIPSSTTVEFTGSAANLTESLVFDQTDTLTFSGIFSASKYSTDHLTVSGTLEVTGSANILGSFSLTSSANTRLNVTTAGQTGYLVGISVNSPAGGFHVLNAESGTAHVPTAGDNDTYLSTRFSDNSLLFAIGNVERMRITGSYVGIGTTDPAQMLEVSGAITIPNGQGYMSKGFSAGEQALIWAAGDDSVRVGNDSIWTAIHFMPGTTIAMTLTGSNGNLGIGTTNPVSRIHVEGGDIVVRDSGGDPFLNVGDNSNDNAFFVWRSSDNYLEISTQIGGISGGHVILQPQGQHEGVGIGTTSPGGRLHVASGSNGVSSTDNYNTLIVEKTNNNGIHMIAPNGKSNRIVWGAPSGAAWFEMQGGYDDSSFNINNYRAAGYIALNVGASPTRVMRITGSGTVGRVGIGTTSDIVSELHVWGEVSASSLSVLSASFEYLTGFTASGDVLVDGDLTVSGIITAQEFHTEFVSASITFSSGSNKFGDSEDDRHTFTGSLFVSGTAIILKSDNNAIALQNNAGTELVSIERQSSGEPNAGAIKILDGGVATISMPASRSVYFNGGNLKFGIGNNSPTETLDVSGSTKFGGSHSINKHQFTGSVNVTGSTHTFFGDVGIGTEGGQFSERVFHVYDATANRPVRIQSDDSTCFIEIVDGTDSIVVGNGGSLFRVGDADGLDKFTMDTDEGSMAIGATADMGPGGLKATGSTRFGSLLSHTHVFTGSMLVTGSAGTHIFEGTFEIQSGSLDINGKQAVQFKLSDSNGSQYILSSGDAGSGKFSITENPGGTRFVIDDNGRTGINTSSPGARFHVLSTATEVARFETDQTDGPYISFHSASNSPIGYVGGGNALISGHAQTDFTIRSEDTLNFATNGANKRMQIQSGGTVDIFNSLNVFGSGVITTITSDNDAPLRVVSDNADTAIRMDDPNFTGYFGVHGTVAFMGATSSRADGNLNIMGGGNVGIGTTNPDSLLVLRAVNPRLKLFNISGSQVCLIGHESGSGNFRFVIEDDTANERFSIITQGGNTQGNVGIGSTNPDSLLKLYTAHSAKYTASGDFVSVTDGDMLSIQRNGNNEVNSFVGIHFFGSTNNADGGRLALVHQSSFNGDFVFQLRDAGSSMVERMRITSDGVVQVSSSLDVQGTGSFGHITKGGGSFKIDHPDPNKPDEELWHSFVESPTAGDNLYRFRIEAQLDGEEVVMALPDYWEHLNENPQVWVSPYRMLAQGTGWISDDLKCLHVLCEKAGFYEVLLIGTRKDVHAKAHWHGVERKK